MPTKSNNHFRQDNKLNYIFKRVVLILVILFFGFTIIKGYQAAKEASRLTYDAKDHLARGFDYLDSGDTSKALEEVSGAQSDIAKLKLLAQSWGQDIQYLRYSYSANSRLDDMERMLNASNLILTTVTSLDTQISDISSKNLMGAEVSDKGTKIFVNIAEGKNTILKITNTAKENLSSGKRDLVRADNNLPEDWKGNVEQVIDEIDKSLSSIDTLETVLTKDLSWLSGEDGQEKNILLLFQNNEELRGGSGGPLGSFGIAKFNNGQLTSLDFGQNIYKLDNPYRSVSKENPPDEIKWVAPGGLVMKDSGWAVDGPESLQKIEDYYTKESGNKVDGVVMVDTYLIEQLLDIVGPINLPQYGKTIDSKNLRLELDNEVHQDYFTRAGSTQENEPKKIISEMMPIFMNRLFDAFDDKAKAIKVLSIFSKVTKSKDLLFYFNNADFQTRLDNLNLSGNIKSTVGDYLYLNNSNIGGEKSSLNVKESVNLKINIGSDGKIQNQVNLLRNHTGNGIWPDGINKNFVRMLIPQGSKLLSFDQLSGNFQIYYSNGLYSGNKPYYLSDDHNKTQLNFWMSTESGKSSSCNIAYLSNYKVDTSGDFVYDLLIQKQPGALADNFQLELNYPKNFIPTNVKKNNSASNFTINLTVNSDKEVKIKFKRIK